MNALETWWCGGRIPNHNLSSKQGVEVLAKLKSRFDFLHFQEAVHRNNTILCAV